MKQPIPVTIVTGFLGSGKTTLLCDLLERRQDRRIAVLINELGEVSIDGALARARTGSSDEVQIVDFAQGLIAYAEDSNFVPTLREIAGRRGGVDHVLIETSGVALPSAAMSRLQSSELAGEFVLDATLAIVDTPLLLAGEFDSDQMDRTRHAVVANAAAALFDQQLNHADVVVLNKIDDLPAPKLLEAEERVRKRAQGVRFVELAYRAQLDARLALGLRLHQATGPTRLNAHYKSPAPTQGTDWLVGANWQPIGDHGQVDGHAHSGLNSHLHGLRTHTHFHDRDPGWLSFTLRSELPQDPVKLEAAVVSAAESEPILRCKGFVRSNKASRPVLLQGVRSRVVLSDAAANIPLATSELVFIGYHLNRSHVSAILTALTETPWS